MSWVTNVILLYGLAEDLPVGGTRALLDDSEWENAPVHPLEAINEWLEDNVDGELVNVASLLDGHGKAFEAGCYAGAINYLDIDAFLAFVKAQQWKSPNLVQVLVKDQEDPTFTLHTI